MQWTCFTRIAFITSLSRACIFPWMHGVRLIYSEKGSSWVWFCLLFSPVNPLLNISRWVPVSVRGALCPIGTTSHPETNSQRAFFPLANIVLAGSTMSARDCSFSLLGERLCCHWPLPGHIQRIETILHWVRSSVSLSDSGPMKTFTAQRKTSIKFVMCIRAVDMWRNPSGSHFAGPFPIRLIIGRSRGRLSA